VGKVEDHLNDIGVEGRIILKIVLQETAWDSFDWLRIETSGELLKSEPTLRTSKASTCLGRPFSDYFYAKTY
jgi:hypothetical protein